MVEDVYIVHRQGLMKKYYGSNNYKFIGGDVAMCSYTKKEIEEQIHIVSSCDNCCDECGMVECPSYDTIVGMLKEYLILKEGM